MEYYWKKSREVQMSFLPLFMSVGQHAQYCGWQSFQNCLVIVCHSQFFWEYDKMILTYTWNFKKPKKQEGEASVIEAKW